MKVIVVEGKNDSIVIDLLFPQINSKGIIIRVANGFSSAFATMKAYIDYGYEVLAVFDTDSHLQDNDNRSIIERIVHKDIPGRRFNIVWMDPSLDGVLGSVVPSFSIKEKDSLRKLLDDYRPTILELDVFKTIKQFVET